MKLRTQWYRHTPKQIPLRAAKWRANDQWGDQGVGAQTHEAEEEEDFSEVQLWVTKAFSEETERASVNANCGLSSDLRSASSGMDAVPRHYYAVEDRRSSRATSRHVSRSTASSLGGVRGGHTSCLQSSKHIDQNLRASFIFRTRHKGLN